MNNILGLDIGDVRIGVSIGFSETKNCFPLEAIKKSEALEKIKELVKQKEISLLVIGLPLNEDNSETSTSKKIRELANKLKLATNNIPIVFVDEYYSSQEAKERLNIKVKDKKTRDTGIIDSVSATIILERYFLNEGIIV